MTEDLLNKLLLYQPATGKIYWKERLYEDFAHLKSNSVDSWNTRYAGKVAFTCVNGGGYYVGTVLGKQNLAHRVIWKMHNKDWPKYFIDHIDGDKLNNRLCNLREVSAAESSRNLPLKSDNKTGFFGLYQIKSGKWRAFITGEGSRQIHLGYFDNLEEAVKCRKEAEVKYEYHENHGRTK
jgi:hypothetical protein